MADKKRAKSEKDTICLRINPEDLIRLKKVAQKNNKSVNSIVCSMIHNYLPSEEEMKLENEVETLRTDFKLELQNNTEMFFKVYDVLNEVKDLLTEIKEGDF